MRKALLMAIIVAFMTSLGVTGHATAAKLKSPTVELERVEVASYFPWADKPTRVPLILAFIFRITNPNDVKVALEDLKFTYGFEAKPGEYFDLNTPTLYDTTYIPAKTTNQLRVVSVLDSMIVPSTLAVSAGARVQALELKIPEVVKMWWEQIGDFSFGIRVSEGVAYITSQEGDDLVFFEGKFPKK